MASSRFLFSCVALAVLFCGAQAFMPPVSDDGFYRGEEKIDGWMDGWRESEGVFLREEH